VLKAMVALFADQAAEESAGPAVSENGVTTRLALGDRQDAGQALAHSQ